MLQQPPLLTFSILTMASTFYSLFLAPPILDTICGFLEILEVKNLRLTCKDAERCISKKFRYVDSLESELSEDFADANNILLILSKYLVVVGGSNVCRAQWPDIELESTWLFYTSNALGVAKLNDHMLDKENMTRTALYTVDRHSTKLQNQATIIYEKGEIYVKIIHDHILDAICSLNTTATLCFTTEFSVYILRPDLVHMRKVKPIYYSLLCTYNLEENCCEGCGVIPTTLFDDIMPAFENLNLKSDPVPLVIDMKNVRTAYGKLRNFSITRILRKDCNVADDWDIFKDMYMTIEFVGTTSHSSLDLHPCMHIASNRSGIRYRFKYACYQKDIECISLFKIL